MSDFVKLVKWVRKMAEDHSMDDIRAFYDAVKSDRCSNNDFTKAVGFCPDCDKAVIDSAFNALVPRSMLRTDDFCCNQSNIRHNSFGRRPFHAMNCRSCCDEHVDCSNCDGRYHRDDFCADCDRCVNGCCHCVTCEGCDERYANPRNNFCCDCNHGHDCCGCQCENKEHSGVEFFDSTLKFHNSNKMEFKRNKSKRFIAAEIEVAKMDPDYAGELGQTVRKWNGSIVHDGSLPETGFEINTAPANGDRYIEEIGAICDKLTRGDADVSTACGLHVHVDARDYDFYALKNLIRVYAAIENTLYNMVPASRKSSSYCIPCGEKYMSWVKSAKNNKNDVRYAIIRATYSILNTKDKKTNKYDSARYNALNLHSFFFRKTIECRMFNGTVAKDKIRAWGKLWAYILDYAKQNSWKEIERNLPMSMPELYNKSPSMGIENLLFIAGDDKTVRDFILERIQTHGDNNHKAIAQQLIVTVQQAA